MAPCRDCKERHERCWSECQAYKAYDEANKKRRAETLRRSTIEQYNVDRILKTLGERQRLRKKNGKEW